MTDAPEPALPTPPHSAVPDARDAGPAPVRGHGAHIVVERLGKAYFHGGKALPILWDVNITLHPGDMVAVVGASGVGKSTFLQILGTLDLPTSGSIKFDGEELTTMSPSRLAEFRNRQIGFVFQFHHLLPDFTALENVMMPALIQRMSTERARRRARDILGRVGLAHRLTHRPGELSGGEQQRVALARAIVTNPLMILADEPTGALDSANAAHVLEIFKGLESPQRAVVMVTHDPAVAATARRKVSMRDGRIVSDEPVAAAMS